MKNERGKEIIQLIAPHPFDSYLDKEYYFRSENIGGIDARELKIPSRHWLILTMAQMFQLNPMSITVVLYQKPLTGVIQLNINRNSSIKAMMESSYQEAFITFYMSRAGRNRQVDIIREWLDRYELDDSIKKYQKMFRRRSEKIK